MFFKQHRRHLFGDTPQFSMVCAGRRIYRYGIISEIVGGNVRVGMEDSLYINSAGELATSNAQQVAKMVDLLHQFDFEVATPDEAREMLSLKGGDKTNF